MAHIYVADLRCEYQVNPLGLGVQRPRLCWRLLSSQRNVHQSAYQVRVAAAPALLANPQALLWDSGKVPSGASIHQVYGGPPLTSGARYYWQVRVWDGPGAVSAWSDPAWWEMGLLEPADWQAQWITPAWEEDPEQEQPAPLLRTVFRLDGEVARARLYVTALGLYTCEINGERVGDYLLAPGWTSYHKRLQVQSYDVAAQLRPGENALGAILGEGWYRGRIGALGGQRRAYGDRLGLLLQMVVTYVDGSVAYVVSDESWQATPGPIRAAGIYDGETYDARHAQPGWSSPDFIATEWSPIAILDYPKAQLVAWPGPYVRRKEELTPVSTRTVADGAMIVDFGENIAGWVRLQVQGTAGTTVTMRHAEVLDRDGRLYTENLRSAKQTDQYTLHGRGMEQYEPSFTFHGFRYVEVRGQPALPPNLKITAVAIYSDLEPAGTFACSDPRINRLQRNIVRSQRGNFIDVPTDCPQRDERLGWTGDAQVFARTACFNMQTAPFFTKWLQDLAADQLPNGAYPIAAPMPKTVVAELSAGTLATLPVQIEFGYGVAGWSDAGVIVPWILYLCYGDTRILEEQYPGMVRWVENMHEKAGADLIWRGWFQFGDWLAINAPSQNDMVATAYFAHSTHLLSKIARVLGRADDGDRYHAAWLRIRAAFRERFVTADGQMQPESQTAYVLGLAFELLLPEQRAPAAQRLVALIRARNNHLSTGFIGAPQLCEVLADAGYVDVAYDLLFQDTFPSWLYPISMGATTIWERWNSMQPDGAIFHPAMNSFNHYAYGAIGEWLYRNVGGIDLDERDPGYKHVIIRPQVGGGLTWARATLASPYGEISSAWRLEGADLHIDVGIPPNASATVYVPAQAGKGDILEGDRPLRASAGDLEIERVGGTVAIRLGSGNYQFAAPYAPAERLPSPEPDLSYREPRFTIYTSVSGVLADEEARAVLFTHLPAASERLQHVMQRHRIYSLYQLAAFVPELLTPERLAAIDRDLRVL